MNRLSLAKRVQILSMLCEGMSMRAIWRIADVSNTVSKLLVDAGKACATFHERRSAACRPAACRRTKSGASPTPSRRMFAKAKAAPVEAGDTWTWTAIEADTKLIVSWLVGGRDGEYAMAFMDDLRSRLTDALSKKFENHVHMVALYTVFYNWTRVHKSLQVTPAMEAGIADHLWSMEEIAEMIDATLPKPGRPKSYKKREAENA